MQDRCRFVCFTLYGTALLFGLLLAPEPAHAASPVWLECVGSTYQVTSAKPEGERQSGADGKNQTPSLFFIVDRGRERLALYSRENRSSRPIPGALFGRDRVEFSYTDGADPRAGWIDRQSLNFHVDDRRSGATSWSYDEGNCVIIRKGSLAGDAAKK